MKSEMQQCKMVQASRMSDLNALIDKFRRIGDARAKGDMRGARKLFRTIKVSDFPSMAAFPMSHGLLCEPNDALFFIDHDWDGHGGRDWCNCFISDVIGVLSSTSFPQEAQIMSNVLPSENPCEKNGGDELEKTPATRIVSAITDLTNRIGEAARAINKAYDTELKREMDLEVALEDSFFCNSKRPRRIAKKILLMNLPMLRDNKHRWRTRFTYDCSNTKIRWSVGLQILRGFFHIETFDGVLTICPGMDELRRRRKARK